MRDESSISGKPDLFLPQIHSSRLWKRLRSIPSLRSGLYFLLELRRALHEEKAQQELDRLFQLQHDPWYFETSSSEHERFARQTAMLDSVSDGNLFSNGLEIGCAEGWYTQTLSGHCKTLLALDLSHTALARARDRREWPNRVCFAQFDLRRQSLPTGFDLIVIAAVLEYMPNPLTLRRVRKKVIDALHPGGYLMVETTRPTGAEALLESSLWSKWLLRGRWINQFILKDPRLRLISSAETTEYEIVLCQKM